MRSSAKIFCTILFSTCSANVSLAQSFGDFQPDYAAEPTMTFDRRPDDPVSELDTQTQSQWFKPSIQIAGATVAPDFKRRGLKVTIPMERFSGGRNPTDDAQTPDAF